MKNRRILWIWCLKRGLVSKEDLIPVFYSNFELSGFLRMCWFHDLNIYFYRKSIRGVDPDATLIERYSKLYDDFRYAMAVLNGLWLLPEHWRETVEFLGYL